MSSCCTVHRESTGLQNGMCSGVLYMHRWRQMTITNTCIHVYIHVCDFTQQFTKVQTIPRDKFAEWLYICIYYIMYV